MQNTSGPFSLDLTDFKKLGINIGLTALAAGLAVAVDNIGNLNMGPYTAVIVPLLSVSLNAALKWVRANNVPAEAPKVEEKK